MLLILLWLICPFLWSSLFSRPVSRLLNTKLTSGAQGLLKAKAITAPAVWESPALLTPEGFKRQHKFRYLFPCLHFYFSETQIPSFDSDNMVSMRRCESLLIQESMASLKDQGCPWANKILVNGRTRLWLIWAGVCSHVLHRRSLFLKLLLILRKTKNDPMVC